MGWEAFLGFRWVDMGTREHIDGLCPFFNFTTFLRTFSHFFLFLTHFGVTVLGRQPHIFQPQSARYALTMQENQKQQYPTNPMDSPPELSQSSHSYMGFEGDADVR